MIDLKIIVAERVGLDAVKPRPKAEGAPAESTIDRSQ